MNFIRRRHAHSQRVENWLGRERCADIVRAGRGWYGTPLPIAGVPGDVRVTGAGDFVGHIAAGSEATLDQWDHDVSRIRVARAFGQHGGFGTLAALRRARRWEFPFSKSGVISVSGATESAWRIGALPAAGSAAAAAPDGTVPTAATTGAFSYTDPDSGLSSHVVQGGYMPSIDPRSCIIYDRIFAVAKTMSSTSTEAVTGVPTRYQSTTQGAYDSAENNFLFVEVGTTLGNTAHNWTVCTYTDQAGNTGATLPSVSGIAQAAAGRLDMPLSTWFCPLASGDTGIKALTQMQCSANVTSGAVDFVIGHALGVMPGPAENHYAMLMGINSGFNFGKVQNDACIALLALIQSAATTTHRGSFTVMEG